MFVIFAAVRLPVQEAAGLAIEVRLRRDGPIAEEPLTTPPGRRPEH
jgi:hypothetical protein